MGAAAVRGTRPLGVDVLTAARSRVAWVFDQFPRIYVSGPSGKDSGVLLHLAAQEARRRGRRIGLLYVDLEAQYQLTITFVREMVETYADVLDAHWVALPIRLRNAVSMAQPYWIAWDPTEEHRWVRRPDPCSVRDPAAYPFFRPAMEFEEFTDEFGRWYADGQATACLVGIRTAESLNRWRAIVRRRKSRIDGQPWTTYQGGHVVNAYPVYDWRAPDIWTFYGRERLAYPRIYDLMYRAGVPMGLQRICQPYGDDQRRGLGLFHVLEPETWSRVVARVAGANSGALYAGKQGNILGNGKVQLPDGHTWQSYARFLLETLPAYEREHYEAKVLVFLRWYATRGYPDGIPDEADPKEEAARKAPSWRRIAKCILKNDRMCRSLGFTQHKSEHYSRYAELMKRRRAEWGISI